MNLIDKIYGNVYKAILLIDDIQDNSLIRREIPSAHFVYGLEMTMMSFMYVYYASLKHHLVNK